MLAFVAMVSTMVVFAVLSRVGRLTADWPQLIQQHRYFWLSLGLGILGVFLYHAAAEGIGTATVGKLVCGLRVVQTDGRPATFRGAVIRSLGYYVDGILFGVVALESMGKGPLRQRYGDAWGKTVVVKTGVFQPNPARSQLRMFVGIVLGTLLWAGMFCLHLILRLG